MALPFVLIPSGLFLQPLVWLAALFAFLIRTGGMHAAAMVGVLFFLSPWTRLSFPAGSDHWSVALSVVLTGSWGFWVLANDRAAWHWWLSSVTFGLALSNRFTVWVAVIPLLALLRTFGKRGISWFVPAGLTTLVLSVGPVFVNSAAYLDGPIAMAVSKAEGDAVAHAGVMAAGVTLLVTVLLTFRIRDLPGALLVVAAGLATLAAMVVLTKVPVVGWSAIGSYEATAYNGAWLMFGLMGLAMPRGDRNGSSESRPQASTGQVRSGRRTPNLSSADRRP